MKILLIEDDEELADLLRNALVHQRYVVDLAVEGRTGLDLAEFGEYDLIVLDMQLPDLDGITLCRRLREQNQSTLVLFLTVQNESSSKVAGLDAGADDYVVKPFDLQELLARIRALRRRGPTASSTVWTLGALQLCPQSCLVTYAGRPLTLTSKEYSLLALFLSNPQRVFSQSALIDRLWSLEESPSENTVRAHIKGLRSKLKKAGAGDIIETIYGIGYRLKMQATKEVVETAMSPPTTVTANTMPPELIAIWESYGGHSYERINQLDRAIQTMCTDQPTALLLKQAQREAHTLMGSLGSFGLVTAEQLARQIYQQLGQISLSRMLSAAEIGKLRQQVQALRQAVMQSPMLPSLTMAPPAHLRPLVRLLIVTANQPQAEQLAVALQQTDLSVNWAIQVNIVSQPTAAHQTIAASPPDVVLLDLSGHDADDEEALRLLADLSTQQPPIPVLVSTTCDEFSDRVKVARLGARGFLTKPILPHQLMVAIDQVGHRSRHMQTKLMAVDDDPQVLAVLQILLAPWGFALTPLDDPGHFWEVLQKTQPDLLILNIEMPTFDGIDLCHTLRNDQRWYNLPVIFLSAHTDLPTISQAFNAGADDYIRKPIVGSELVARVLHRLDQVQSSRRL